MEYKGINYKGIALSHYEQGILDEEARVEDAIWVAFGEELQCVRAAFDCASAIYTKVVLRIRQGHHLDDDMSHVTNVLFIRSFNSLRIALISAEHGYYQQALTLCRMAMEDWIFANDAELNNATLDALMGRGCDRLGRGRLAIPEMAKRVLGPDDQHGQSKLVDNYGFLSEYGAHPRGVSHLGIMSHAGKKWSMHIGPFFDKRLAGITLQSLLAQITGMLMLASKLSLMHGIDPKEIVTPSQELLDEALASLKEKSPE